MTHDYAIEAMHQALREVNKMDPQSPTCGPQAPDRCENGCIGCVARRALKVWARLGTRWSGPDMHYTCKHGNSAECSECAKCTCKTWGTCYVHGPSTIVR